MSTLSGMRMLLERLILQESVFANALFCMFLGL